MDQADRYHLFKHGFNLSSTFKTLPDAGTDVNLVSRTGNASVARATVVECNGGKFQGRSLEAKSGKRVVVKITEVIVGATLLLYPKTKEAKTALRDISVASK